MKRQRCKPSRKLKSSKTSRITWLHRFFLVIIFFPSLLQIRYYASTNRNIHEKNAIANTRSEYDRPVNKASELTIIENDPKLGIYVLYDENIYYNNLHVSVTYGTLFNCKKLIIPNNSGEKMTKNVKIDKNALLTFSTSYQVCTSFYLEQHIK